MKILFSLLTLSFVLFASTDTDACKKCHPLIFKEFQTSMHKKSTIREDKVHKAIWDKHPAKAKGNYKCAKCHTPNLAGQKEHTTGITCIACHTIKSVEEHAQSNKNIYSGKKKTFYSAEKGRENEKVLYKQKSSLFGLSKTTVGSAYHDIDYTNKNFYDAQMCMGCHSHKQNGHKFSVCTTNEAGVNTDKSNCITCHMPKVDGSATTVRISKQHAYHGFAGARVKPELLSQYLSLGLSKGTNSFDVTINNAAPHNLFTHPLRVVQLRTRLHRDGKTMPLKTHTFVKIIGKNGKPAMPWVADAVIKDTMIKANENRAIHFDTPLQKGDRVEVQLGYFIVNPKVLKKLKLQDDKELAKFHILKAKNFAIIH